MSNMISIVKSLKNAQGHFFYTKNFKICDIINIY